MMRLSVKLLRDLIVKKPPLSLREIRPDLPGWVYTLIDKALAKDPRQRIQTASEFLEYIHKHRERAEEPPQAEKFDQEKPKPTPPAPRKLEPTVEVTVCIDAPADRSVVHQAMLDVRGRAAGTNHVEMYHPVTGKLLRETVAADGSFCFKNVAVREQTNRCTVTAGSCASVMHSVQVIYERDPDVSVSAELLTILSNHEWEIGDPSNRCATAIAGLVRRHGMSVMLTLVDEMSHDPSPTVRCNTAVALSTLADIPRFVERAMPLADLRFDNLMRLHTADYLERFTENNALGTLLIAMKYDPVANVRRKSLHALLVLKGEQAIPPIREVLRYDDAFSVREAACESLGLLRAKEAIDDLLQALERDLSVAVKGKALEALDRIGDPRAISNIKSVIEFLNPGIKVKAQGVLGHLAAIARGEGES
jgi:hypothetical protein